MSQLVHPTIFALERNVRHGGVMGDAADTLRSEEFRLVATDPITGSVTPIGSGFSVPEGLSRPFAYDPIHQLFYQSTQTRRILTIDARTCALVRAVNPESNITFFGLDPGAGLLVGPADTLRSEEFRLVATDPITGSVTPIGSGFSVPEGLSQPFAYDPTEQLFYQSIQTRRILTIDARTGAMIRSVTPESDITFFSIYSMSESVAIPEPGMPWVPLFCLAIWAIVVRRLRPQ